MESGIFLSLFIAYAVPSDYKAGYSADMFFSRVPNCIANGSTLTNYTVAVDSSFFGAVSRVALSLIGTDRSERFFKLSDGTSSRNYDIADLQIAGQVTLISDSIIAVNLSGLPLPVETFSLGLAALIVGRTQNGLQIAQANSRFMAEVIEPAGKLTF